MGQRNVKRWLNSRCWWLVLLCLPSAPCFSANTLQTELPAGVDVSHWDCSYCAFEQGYSGEVEAGVGYVSDDSYKFGEYNGLNDKGGFLVGNATLRYRNNNASYLDLQARDLGLDSRFIDIKAGQQGKYGVFLNYHEISHYLFNTAKTPYRGNGSDVLQLPPGWITAGSTAGMTGLATSLHSVELKTQRRQISFGASYLPISHWETTVQFHHEVRDGQIATAGTFFFNSAQLVQPIDYVTNDAEVAVSYTAQLWQFKLAYYASFFDNHDTSLTWQNAYNPVVAGADKGQLALPPSNQFHQILFSSGYQFSQRTYISGDFAVGRMEQDEQLLAATVNPGLVVALPESSANARVDTLTANLRINSRVSNKLRLNAAYRYNDRDNKTPSYLFNWVTTDAFTAIARRNLPYSFTDKNLNLGGDYRFGKRYKLSAGYKNTNKLRTHQEVDRTTENTVWGKISAKLPKDIDIALKAAHGERSASGFHLVSDTIPAQNPLLRKYNMADRIRNSGSLQASFTFSEKLSVDVNIDYSHDNYSNSVLGMTESHDVSYNADGWLLLTDKTNLHAFAGRERIKSDQVGSQSFSVPDWFAKNDDTIDNLGFGVKQQLMLDKLDIGADYMLLRSLGKISINTGSSGSAFPDLKSNLSTLKLYADYRVQENMTLHAAFWYERYHSTDWMVDNVDPATVSNVLALGLDSPDYDVHTLMMTVRYRF